MRVCASARAWVRESFGATKGTKTSKSYKVITFGQHYYDFTLRYNVTKHPRFVTKPCNVVFMKIAPQK